MSVLRPHSGSRPDSVFGEWACGERRRRDNKALCTSAPPEGVGSHAQEKIKKTTTKTKKREKPKPARATRAGRSTGAKARDASTAAAVVEPPEKAVCPIVGMGASAGGLEAFEHFFTHMPSDSGLAFVLILHLDPSAKSLLVELLARNTKMPVCRAEQGMKVEPDHVYITPPGAALTIQRGVLQVVTQKEPRRPPLPVDTFLRSPLLSSFPGAVLTGPWALRPSRSTAG
jgi:chemotaxis response regulator CheB